MRSLDTVEPLANREYSQHYLSEKARKPEAFTINVPPFALSQRPSIGTAGVPAGAFMSTNRDLADKRKSPRFA